MKYLTSSTVRRSNEYSSNSWFLPMHCIGKIHYILFYEFYERSARQERKTIGHKRRGKISWGVHRHRKAVGQGRRSSCCSTRWENEIFFIDPARCCQKPCTPRQSPSSIPRIQCLAHRNYVRAIQFTSSYSPHDIVSLGAQ